MPEETQQPEQWLEIKLEQPRKETQDIDALIRSFKKSPAVKDAMTAFGNLGRRARPNHRYRCFYLSPSQRKKLQKVEARRNCRGNSPHDPLMEEIFASVRPKKKRSKKFHFRKPKPQIRKRGADLDFQKRRLPHQRENKEAGLSLGRASMVVPIFVTEDGRKEILLQLDKNDDGTPKGGWGFVFGHPDSKEETDEQVAFRETGEETGIPKNIGELISVGPINVDANYYVAVFAKILPWDTPHKPGEEIYVKNGKPCQGRYDKEKILLFRGLDLIRRKHDLALEMVIIKGLF